MTHTLTDLVLGLVFKIAIVAINNEGVSDQSNYVLIGATEIPQPTSSLFKTSGEKTSITIEWERVVETAMPITGYLLQVADFGSVDFQTIFNGNN
jgi:hypothetical protein